MAIAFQSVVIRFDPTRGQTQREVRTAVFGHRVLRADAAIKGFRIGYTDGDHHIWRQNIDVDVVQVRSNTVDVAVDLLFRDSSGNIDDRFDGTVEVLVIAETA